jgi:mRNA-degrading endonuclease YafQ of YafQ-DinJ toxin-antitoxin module
MKITKAFYHPDFKKSINNNPQKEKLQIIRKINLFLDNPYSSSLKTHKLSGKLKDYWSFSVSYSQRILFRFCDKESVEFIDIGEHEIYK